MTNAETAARMGEAAARLLASLAPDQRAKGCFPFPAWEERTRWYYTPNERAGLPLAEMTEAQQRAAHQLLAAGMSAGGYATAAVVMGLERVLDAREGWRRARPRDPSRYWVSLFGAPHAKDAWAWRFEGHHVSVHHAIEGGRVVAPTPTFLGANPAETPLGASTLRPLAAEEDLARELVHALDVEQRAIAILSRAAPPDLVTANRPRLAMADGARPLTSAEMQGRAPTDEERANLEARTRALGATPDEEAALAWSAAPKGLSAASMTRGQREILLHLVRAYVARMPDDVAEIELARVARIGVERLSFAWAGGIERRQPHYYRVHGPRLLLEYDNTQNDVNHVHAVWRDPENDFGWDALAHHYAREH